MVSGDAKAKAAHDCTGKAALAAEVITASDNFVPKWVRERATTHAYLELRELQTLK